VRSDEAAPGRSSEPATSNQRGALVWEAETGPSHQITIDRGVRIPMRDGTSLVADIYRPASDGEYPVLLQRTPYDRASNTNALLMLNPLRAASSGFAVVIQDTRGRFDSAGDFEPFVTEMQDGYDSVEWCARQRWSNQRVGMYGMSYVGATQWLAAAAKPPHLRAIAPQLSSSSFNDGWLRHNGVLALGFVASWLLGSLAPDTFRRLRRNDPKLGATMRRALATLDDISTWLETTPFNQTDVLQGVAPFFSDWLNRNDVGYLAALQWEPSPESAPIPALIVGGWYDSFLWGTLESYAKVKATVALQGADKSPHRLLIGPWQHILPMTNVAGEIDFGTRSSPQSVDLDGIQLDWFNAWLRPSRQGLDGADAPVRVFVMGKNVWQTYDDWPPPESLEWPLYLGPSGHDDDVTRGSLRAEPVQNDSEATAFVSDPSDPVPSNGGGLCCWPGALPAGAFDQRGVEQRDDVLTFSTRPLAVGVDVVGPVVLRLYFSADVTDVDICAKLVDVQPCGYARNVCDGVARARYRQSRAAPELMTPGQICELTVDMTATACHFGPGHRIRVEVAGSNFPKYERNPQNGQPPMAATSFAKAAITIHHSSDYPSQLVLWVPNAMTAEAAAAVAVTATDG
jgi:putative CocE/NonD family hydrolase